MYKGFNLEITTNQMKLLNEQWELLAIVSRLKYNEDKRVIKKTITKFLRPNGSIDGSALQSCWFPSFKADVFISHSHKDLELARGLAGILKTHFGLTSFIDSCVWAQADDLLLQLDNAYCIEADGKYSYEMRNLSTAHVHTMLSTALNMMIDETECLIFINTPNSITFEDVIAQTASPWIYNELLTSRIIRKITPLRLITQITEQKLNKLPPITYRAPLNHLKRIDIKSLIQWNSIFEKKGKRGHALDYLYQLTN